MPIDTTPSSNQQEYKTYFHVVYSPFDRKWHINVTKSRDIAFHAQKKFLLQEARDFANNQEDSYIIFHR